MDYKFEMTEKDMNILKEKGDVVKHHAHEYDSSTYTLLFNAKNDKDEMEYDK